MLSDGPRNFAFSVFTFDAESAELRRNGGRLRIPEQASRVLTLLLENAGTVVTREELRRYLWPSGEFLDHDHSISNAVSQLRTVLRDHSRTPKFIETIPKRGYRFVAEVSVLPPICNRVSEAPPATQELDSTLLTPFPQPESTPSGSAKDQHDQTVGRAGARAEFASSRIKTKGLRWAVLCTVGLVLFAAAELTAHFSHRRAQQSAPVALGIAPFEVSGTGAEQFADSFRMDLIDAMSNLPKVQMRAAHSFSNVKVDKTDIRKLASTLKLDAIVFGRFTINKQRLQLELELVNGHNATHLASFRYNGTTKQLASIRDRAEHDIFSRLHVATASEPRKPGSTDNPQAYEAYLRARYHLSEWTNGSLSKAFDEFNEALTADPNFANAYAGMASAYVAKAEHNLGPRKENYDKAEQAAAKAVQLDPTLAEAHAILGFVAFRRDWNAVLAEKELREAVELDPSQAMPHLWLAVLLGSTGRFQESLQEVDIARTADPLWPAVYLTDNYLATNARQYKRAAEDSRKLLLLVPNWPLALDQQAWLLWYTGHYLEAINEWRAMASSEHDAARMALEDRGLEAFRRGGVPAYARIKIEAIESGHHWAHPNDFGAAEWYLNAGDKDKAIAALKAMVEHHDPECIQFAVSPAYAGLHHDPRFLRLLARVGLSLPHSYPKATSLTSRQ